MQKIYHLCFPENKVPGATSYHNTALQKAGATISLKYRRGPIFKEDAYLVFWREDEKTFFSRINPVRYGLDAFFFKDGHEMVECRDWEELTEKLKEFHEKGYCYDRPRKSTSL